MPTAMAQAIGEDPERSLAGKWVKLISRLCFTEPSAVAPDPRVNFNTD